MKTYHLPDSDGSIAAAVCERLRNGEVGILPTETVYGLMCSVATTDGADRIAALKGRDPNKHFQILLADISDLDQMNVAESADLQRLASAFWPGPLTVVTRDRNGEFVGIRIPDHDFVRTVISNVGSPFTATSANAAGAAPQASAEKGFTDLTSEPDFAVLVDQFQSNAASTVIRLDNGVEILRQGAIEVSAILKVLDPSPG
jgi:L-threonylcarbamoyladenylate synthase